VSAFLDGLGLMITLAGGNRDGEWFLGTVRDDCLANIQGQPVFVQVLVEHMLYMRWAQNRVLTDPGHKNLTWGFANLPSSVRQYDRRIARALWEAVEMQLEPVADQIVAKYKK